MGETCGSEATGCKGANHYKPTDYDKQTDGWVVQMCEQVSQCNVGQVCSVHACRKVLFNAVEDGSWQVLAVVDCQVALMHRLQTFG